MARTNLFRPPASQPASPPAFANLITSFFPSENLVKYGLSVVVADIGGYNEGSKCGRGYNRGYNRGVSLRGGYNRGMVFKKNGGWIPEGAWGILSSDNHLVDGQTDRPT
ncbi:hypothetical protein DPMN_037375 [Dreissena polymorpha]|uniref:Uncharacterized protein n=1 Tax=Dreissena polymorpha TaxID=45954 RepID=A0A9D4MEE1_DREPO|nr:hypothetical protein DPMN_037375 [Dreissena polymorpha]